MSFTSQPTLWVLIADGERARIVTPEAHRGRFRTILDLGSAEHPHYPPSLRQDPHQLDKQQFAIGLAGHLNAEAETRSYEKLVLAAPGHILHAVREALNKAAAALVVGTLSKDLTNVPDHDLTEHLADWWMGLPASA
jgi:protein required for attachment to host cells